MAALAHLKTAEQFSAVIEASKKKPSHLTNASALAPAPVVARSIYLKSAHFVMHVGGLPHSSVDQAAPPLHPAVGVIIPKRWAKRAVTRNTFKRQFYAVAQTYAQALQQQLPGCGLVLRQTAAFARDQFVSARSPALKAAARLEIEQLFSRMFANTATKPQTPAGAVE